MNPCGTKLLETPRLILRPFGHGDAQAMFDTWASDPEVTRFLTWPTYTSVEVTRRVLTDWISRYGDNTYFNWGITLKPARAVVGNIAVVSLHEDTKAADVGYCLGRAYWGKGIMTEALRAVLDFLFDEVGLNRVAAYHDVRNTGSGRVMEKAGMKREGVLRAAGRNNSGICDEVWYATVKSDRTGAF